MNKKKNSGQLYKRIIVKLGTSLLTGSTDHLDREKMSVLVNQIAKLHSQGVEILVVSSGAIAAGRYKLGRVTDRKGIPYRQVLASIGQGQLMNIYDQLFSESGITIAQALLSKSDLTDRAGSSASWSGFWSCLNCCLFRWNVPVLLCASVSSRSDGYFPRWSRFFPNGSRRRFSPAG